MSEPDVVEPPEVRAAAAGLGPLRRVERLVTQAFYYWAVAGLGAVGVAGVGLLVLLMRRAPEPWFRVVLALFGLGGLAYLCWVVGLALRRARTVGAIDLYEYDGGFVRSSRLDTIAFPWSGVAFVENVFYEGGAQGSGSLRRVYFLRRLDDLGRTTEPLSLHRDVDRVAARVTEANLPDALATARSISGIAFGALMLGPDGVTFGEETTPWIRLDRVVREKDEIRLYRDGERTAWARTPIGTVLNAPVMLAVAASLLADAGRVS
jgi:hypothetical protein